MARIKDNSAAFMARMREAEKKFMEEVGLVYTSEVRRLMVDSPRGGKTYRVGKRGRTHKASAPGEPPAVNTGTLVRSIGYRVTQGPTGWSAQCGSAIKVVPIALEYGTTTIAPRPAWRPALMKIRDQVKAAAQRAFGRVGGK